MDQTKTIKESRLESARHTSNFIATPSKFGESITLYFDHVIRKHFGNGGEEIIGVLEILGELVMASDDERTLVGKGNMDYFFMTNVTFGMLFNSPTIVQVFFANISFDLTLQNSGLYLIPAQAFSD